jgi:hypothetical protein
MLKAGIRRERSAQDSLNRYLAVFHFLVQSEGKTAGYRRLFM